jgi:hypothetical protein
MPPVVMADVVLLTDRGHVHHVAVAATRLDVAPAVAAATLPAVAAGGLSAAAPPPR